MRGSVTSTLLLDLAKFSKVTSNFLGFWWVLWVIWVVRPHYRFAGATISLLPCPQNKSYRLHSFTLYVYLSARIKLDFPCKYQSLTLCKMIKMIVKPYTIFSYFIQPIKQVKADEKITQSGMLRQTSAVSSPSETVKDCIAPSDSFVISV